MLIHPRRPSVRPSVRQWHMCAVLNQTARSGRCRRRTQCVTVKQANEACAGRGGMMRTTTTTTTTRTTGMNKQGIFANMSVPQLTPSRRGTGTTVYRLRSKTNSTLGSTKLRSTVFCSTLFSHSRIFSYLFRVLGSCILTFCVLLPR